jgi:hypothetical protein
VRLKPVKHNSKTSARAKPDGFTGMKGLIWSLALKLKMAGFYEKLWNPINYGIIGGIGVVINYIVNIELMLYMPWFISNGLAILTAFVWNWANSVGPLGHYWGFPRRAESK